MLSKKEINKYPIRYDYDTFKKQILFQLSYNELQFEVM